jgi:hypothetical protein
LTGTAHDLLDEGFAVLPGAVPEDLLAQAQVAFETGYLPSPDWPTPREADWRHAQVDLDPAIQAICRLPALLAAAGQLIGAPFFLMQVEGREPLRGNPEQQLHRDAEGSGHKFAIAMIFLDPYSSENGATRIVPRSHRADANDNGFIVSGQAGDIVVMDANLLHGATTNRSGAPRRSLLVTYADATLRDELCHTEALRGVRMDTRAVFGR